MIDANLGIAKFKNSRINRSFVKDEVYDKLSEWIITGHLKPETKININDLSDILGTSRTPVREAILRLENEGLILSKANRWTIVSPINLDDSLYTYSVVATLEALALEQAYDNIDNNFIKDLESINEALKNSLDTATQLELIEFDNAFHNKIIYLSKNPEIPPIIDSLKKKIRRLEFAFFKDLKKKSTTYNEHKKIIDSLKDDDLKSATENLKNNWYNSIALLKENFNL